MRRFFRERLPDHDSIRQHRWLRPVQHLLQHPNLWHLHRRSVAGGVAIGLLCGLIPGPFQMLAAALLAILLRVNLPVAAFTTFYTNPFTIVPIYLLAYQIGRWVSGIHGVASVPVFPAVHWNDWIDPLWEWLVALGEPLLIGLAVLAVVLPVAGYVIVRLLWRLAVVWRWHRRHLG